MPNGPEFSERARAFMDAQGTERKREVKEDQYSFDPSIYPDIPTLAELKQLRNERPVPSPAPVPGSRNTAHVTESQKLADFERENRIRYLGDRLGQEQENFERSFDQSTEIER